MTTTTFQLRKPLTITSLELAGELSGGQVRQGTMNQAGGASALNTAVGAAQVLNGYTYDGAAGGGVALQLPTGAQLQAACLSQGIVTQAGTVLKQPMVVSVNDANALTVTGGGGATVVGGAAGVQAETAMVYIIFTAAAAYSAFVVNQ